MAFHRTATLLGMKSLRVIQSPNAPKAVGPYSQAIAANGFIYCSGQIPMDPATGDIFRGDIQEQTKICLNNLAAVLNEAGSNLDHVVKVNVFLKSMDDFAKVNETYGKFFNNHKPARAAVQVAKLPFDVGVEIECVAVDAKSENKL